MGRPLRPFEQLMSVFPKQSAHAIPQCYRHLLSEPDSEIIDFYPTNFRLDVNGAAFAWMGVNLLPFIDKERLLCAMARADQNGNKLTAQEHERNKPSGDIVLFVSGSQETTRNKLASIPNRSNNTEESMTLTFEGKDSVHGNCFQTQCEKRFGDKIVKKTFNDEKEVIVQSNKILQVGYHHPYYSEHRTQLLDLTQLPPKLVEEWEINQVDRKNFRGEASIRMLERVLGIDCGFHSRYQFGFKNNHASHETGD